MNQACVYEYNNLQLKLGRIRDKLLLLEQRIHLGQIIRAFLDQIYNKQNY